MFSSLSPSPDEGSRIGEGPCGVVWKWVRRLLNIQRQRMTNHLGKSIRSNVIGLVIEESERRLDRCVPLAPVKQIVIVARNEAVATGAVLTDASQLLES